MTYSFRGTQVEVEKGETAYVVMNAEGDSVSVIYNPKVESQIGRGIWEEAEIWKLSESGATRLRAGRCG